MSWVDCPDCDDACADGEFGDDAYCPTCGKSWETDWDYLDAFEGTMTAWVVGPAETKEEPPTPATPGT